MKKIITISSLILFLIPQIFAASLADENINGVDRYAIYIGANNGGKGREKLLYAGSDALSFKQAMSEIGGVAESNCRTLIDPSKADVDNAINEVTAEIQKNVGLSKRSEFIFYYSGHSDENSLLLGNTKYDYSTLKAAITAVPSDIHVVILDSCYSGNFIRTKGGQKRKPFLIDDTSVVTGHAYLSSSSDNESSQESDEIESSYFTNAMITGLRGAADTSGDNKVTLNELYSYAFNDTLSKTETSKAGPQHPNYNITLVGSGDLVLSDISSGEAMLSLSKEAKGKFIIRDKNGKLISEINKIPGQPIFMALPSGVYSAIIIEEYSTKQGTFSLEKDQIYVLDQNSLSSLKRKQSRLRGDVKVDNDIEDFDDGDGEILENDFTNPSLIDEDDSDDFSNSEDDEVLDTNDLKNNFNKNGKWINYKQFTAPTDNTVFQLGIVPGFTPVNSNAETVNIALGILGNTTNNIRGIQLSTLLNISNGYIFGGQTAGLANILTGDVMGIQDAGLFSIAENVSGIQISGLFNIAKLVQGVQSAGLFNISTAIRGVQMAGIFSNSRYVQGAQLSGIANITNEVNGVQAAGIINIAKNVKGAQIGLINIAEKNSGVSIGLFNYIKDGVHDVGYAWDTDNMFDFYLRSGTKHLFFTVGYMCYSEQLFQYHEFSVPYVGLGTQINTNDKDIRFCFELLSKWVVDNTDSYFDDYFASHFVPATKLTLNYDFLSFLTVSAGMTFDFMFYGFNDYCFDIYQKEWYWDLEDAVISPSFQIGISINF